MEFKKAEEVHGSYNLMLLTIDFGGLQLDSMAIAYLQTSRDTLEIDFVDFNIL